LNTPAKTGMPGNVKPKNYRPFVEFSIEVYDALDARGWPRLKDVGIPKQRCIVESFPLSAWRSLGISALPAKAKSKPEDLHNRYSILQHRFSIRTNSHPNHDELQAIVSGLAGLALEANRMSGIYISGVAPFEFEGKYREGYIVNPNQRTAE
jgi:hypothetical protein